MEITNKELVLQFAEFDVDKYLLRQLRENKFKPCLIQQL